MADLDKTTNSEFNKLDEEQKNVAQAKSKSIDDLAEHDKPVGLVKSVKQFSLWDWTKIVGLGTASFAYITSILGPITAGINLGATVGNYLIGHSIAYKGKVTKNNTHGEIQLAQTIAPISSIILKYLDSTSGLASKVGFGAVAGPAYIFLYNFIAAPIRKYSPLNFFKNIHKVPGEAMENVGKNFKGVGKVALVAAIPYALIVNFVPLRYQLPLIESVGPFFRYFTKKAERKTEPGESNVEQFPKKQNRQYKEAA